MGKTSKKAGESSPHLLARPATTKDTQPSVKPLLATRRRYTLDELLAQCDRQAPAAADIAAWEAAKPVGWEIL